MVSWKEKALVLEQEFCHSSGNQDAFVTALTQINKLIAFHLSKRKMPTIFVSYAHPAFNETDTQIKTMAEQEAWTRKAIHTMAHDLSACGFKVLIDRKDSQVGGNPTRFMESAVKKSDFILMVCTGLYNLKCSLSTKEHPYYVAYECAKAIERHLAHPEQNIIKPIMLSGTYQESCQFLRQMLPADQAITTEEFALNGFAADIQQSYIDSMMRVIIQMLPEDIQDVVAQEAKSIWQEFAAHSESHAKVLKGLKEQDSELAAASKSWPLVQNQLIQANDIPLFGREADLDAIYDRLHFSQDPFLVISGLGGMGKTLVTRQYVQKFQHHYRMTFWLNAESEEQLMNGFRDIALQLNQSGLLTEELNVGWGPSHQLAEQVIKVLNKQPGWLLVYDNIEDQSLLKQFLPSGHAGHLIATSHNQHLSATNTLQLDALSDESAVALLVHYSKKNGLAEVSDEDKLHLKELAKYLDYLPLALVQAGGMMAIGYSAKEYLVRLKTNHAKLMKSQHALIRQNKYPHSLLTVWQMGWDTLSAQTKEYLVVSSLLAAENQPRALFEQYKEDDFDAAVHELQKHSFINFSYRNEQTVYNCHRLVQQMVLDNVSEEEKNKILTRLIHTMAKQCEPTEEEKKHQDFMSARQRRFMLLSHWDVLQHHAAALKDKEAVCLLLHKMAGTYHERGDVNKALDYYHQAITVAEEVYGKNNLKTIGMKIELGGLYRDLRRATDGLKLYQELLEQLQQLPEDTTQEELRLKTGLACSYCDLNQHALALPVFKELVAKYTELHGSQHRWVIINKYNLGSASWQMGKTDEAIKILTEVAKQVPENDLLLSSGVRNSLAMAHINKNQPEHFKEAERLLKDALKARVTHYSEHHPEVGAVYANLATLHWLQHHEKRAKKYFARSIDGTGSHNILPYCVYLMSQGDWQEAMRLLQDVKESDSSSTFTCSKESSYRLHDEKLLSVLFYLNTSVVTLKNPLFAHYLLVLCQLNQGQNAQESITEFCQQAQKDGSESATLLAGQFNPSFFSQSRSEASKEAISQVVSTKKRM
ncbi:tetratricopeptide repeat protein [Legionella shakespearei]|uniref:NB-ARC domain protein n=1 Tax=Legionella shakespearei DSM 23087 TaxID=1122169 RepID=A0A0W0YHN0_9GAMM|nr:toll/interleukin-1 receptor domain-containing protein [Legionella shakespearei]KTD56458.1 NB-ARC domain protein [Legionella shakespearei DSM 23087]